MEQQPLQRCDNCQMDFPESKVATHFGYCRRNIKKCATCGEMYDINFKEQHEEQYHRMDTCEYCKKQFKPEVFKAHMDSCIKKPQFCQYCELKVPVETFPSHFKVCQSHTKPCTKCNKPITNKQYMVHLVSCPGYVQPPVISQPRSYEQHINQQRKKVEEKKHINNYPVNERERVQYQPVRKPQQHQYANIKTKEPISSKDLYSKPREVEKPRVVYQQPKVPINYNNINKAREDKKEVYKKEQIKGNQYEYRHIGGISHQVKPGKPVEIKKKQPQRKLQQYAYKKEEVISKPATKPTSSKDVINPKYYKGMEKKDIKPSYEIPKKVEYNNQQNLNPNKNVIRSTPYYPTTKHQVPTRTHQQTNPPPPPIVSPPTNYYEQYNGGSYDPYQNEAVEISPEEQQMQQLLMDNFKPKKQQTKPKGPSYSQAPISNNDFPDLQGDMLNESFIAKQKAIFQDVSSSKRR